jgi:hypothetical protein
VTAPLARAAALALLVVCLVATGCAGEESATADSPEAAAPAAKCPAAWRAGWQQLAERIGAPVYCPSWLPAPLTGEIGGEWQGVDSVAKDGSYLMGFIWLERGSGEVHVNLRGYPRQAEIPTCNGKPCFSDSAGKKRVGDREVEVFTVNRGADTWHVLYAWRHEGSLYALSQHVVPDLGLSYSRVVANLDRMLRGLELVEPDSA